MRASSECYCGQIRTFRSDARIVILQHPKETRNRVGTARMARLCLENSELIAGERVPREVRAREIASEPGTACVLLYPGPTAVDLATLPANPAFAGRNLVVFVVDATWAMAKKMVKDSPTLSSLPRVAFEPRKPSGYLFRRQPRPEFVSTIEAIHEVIDLLDRTGRYPIRPPGAHGNLLEVFNWMARRQASRTLVPSAGRC
jgi:DTW domain-containing protein YfiP